MANPYPAQLRACAVRAYETDAASYRAVAQQFAVGEATLQRWVRRQRATGTVDPLARGGGWHSPVDTALLRTLVDERPDRTTDELTRAYNRRAAAPARVHRSSILRALQRLGYVFKNGRGRPNSIGRPSRPNAQRSVPGPPR